jgi:cyclic beta-1,2-glucan synthetase
MSDRAHLDAQWPDLRTRCTVWVSPEDDIELRQVSLWNTSSQAISLELTSAWEVCLSEARADETHPAFGKLFVQAHWDAADHALYFSKRPRLDTEQGLHAVHFMAHADANITLVRVQTDRALWMGRHRDASHPLARMDATLWPSGECVTGLDPMAAMSMQVHVPAHGKVQFTLGTAAAPERATLANLVDRYQQAALIERSSLMSATLSGIRLREMRLPSDDRVAIRLLTTTLCLLLTRPGPLVDPGLCNRQSLWRFGISGDRPVLVVDINDVQGLRMVGSLVQALKLWSWGGVMCDLVVLNGEASSYLMPLRSALNTLSERYLGDANAPGSTPHAGLHLLRTDDLSPTERITLNTLARVQLHADGRSLAHHVQDLVDWHEDAQAERRHQSRGSPEPTPPALGAPRATRGHFHPGDGSFHFKVNAQYEPPRPWINVLANPDFGAHVSEAGGGYTWAGNSKLHQLTAWSNDPVTDLSGEAFFLQNLHTREVWSIGAGPGRANADYSVVHTQGSTTITHRHADLSISATWSVDPQDAVKRVRLEVHNHGIQTTVVRAMGIIDWMMGAQRSDRQSVYTALHSMYATEAQPMQVDVLTATQQDGHAGFGGHTAFMTLHREGSPDASMADWGCDRRAFWDDAGQRVLPDHLGSHGSGAGQDPCAAAAITLNLPAMQSRACVFVIGHAPTASQALSLAQRSTRQSALGRQQASLAHWQALLGAVHVHTPDPLFNALVNHWLLYQSVACRMWAKSGFYQAGGAFGFRDQLQDAMALCTTAPHLLREQLLLSASRQFPQGDVQHWWHWPLGAGVRTHCSDDLLWLAWASALYASTTQDKAIWDTQVPFIDGPPVPPGAEDIYNTPSPSAQHASLYEHCALAIDHSLPVGQHGLPLMGTGDWNDGMNQVGQHGRGESVWLACMLYQLLQDMAPLALARADHERAKRWQLAAQALRAAMQAHAWDGEWFVRAFFDDGSPLGSQHNTECRIDLISQAWSVLSGIGTHDQQTRAMASVQHHLIDPAAGLLHLIDPPLAHQTPSAGYIQAYPPGVRENGGQYNHAAVWMLMAQARMGDADGAYLSFTRLSPAHRSASTEQGRVYGLEPYVMAGDICSQPPYAGRGGWSWYTGSASWMHRAAVESIVGLQVRGHSVCIAPCLPRHWGHITVTLKTGGQRHVFVVCADWDTAEIDKATRAGATPWPAGQWQSLEGTGHQAYADGVHTHLVTWSAPRAHGPGQ